MFATINDSLRRIDGARLKCFGVGILPLGVLWTCKRILPAQIVPVVNVPGEDDGVVERRLIDRAAEELLGGIAGVSSLAGVHLHEQLGLHEGPLSRLFVFSGRSTQQNRDEDQGSHLPSLAGRAGRIIAPLAPAALPLWILDAVIDASQA